MEGIWKGHGKATGHGRPFGVRGARTSSAATRWTSRAEKMEGEKSSAEPSLETKRWIAPTFVFTDRHGESTASS